MTTSTTIIIILILITTASLALHITDRTEMDEIREELWDIMDKIENLRFEKNSTQRRRAGIVQTIEIEIELDKEKKEEFQKDLDAISERMDEIARKWEIITDADQGHNGGEDHDQGTDQEDTEEGVEGRGVYNAERSEELHGLGERQDIRGTAGAGLDPEGPDETVRGR